MFMIYSFYFLTNSYNTLATSYIQKEKVKQSCSISYSRLLAYNSNTVPLIIQRHLQSLTLQIINQILFTIH